MEMKRVNENTIRVVLGAKDLEERGITMLDLLGNQGQIENFFYSILSEVDSEHAFADSEAVTFQVMPNTNGLELLISKSGVRTGKKSNQQNNLSRQEILHGLDELSLSSDRLTTIQQEDHTPELARTYEFAQFEDVIGLAHELKVNGLTSKLMVYRDVYYLELTFESADFSELTATDAWVISNEFGSVAAKSFAEVKENAKVLFEHDALENLRYYFN
ncbi:hypothetical protein LA20533_06485 [Amylolactobacillus amylophilus DSM 20533 = JCM 1125]|uniref:Adapter protein MecA n=1 Tax=Amylolactobacillus amylophilus DSM 20533 = JCM 1125 TaxID=1423721 RepID=A0A1L6XD84_9LACO|nr:hypothetical protein LA20533_06485 [Amylolactobacillus amylophilus DSM 20533 = JCM 1125]GED80051.1 adapter protein MecA [Amylolactobacillus amylophilus]